MPERTGDPEGSGARDDVADADRLHLHSLGYAQELHRGLGLFSNFAISFSIISVLSGGFTAFAIGAIYGGPLAVTASHQARQFVMSQPVSGATTLKTSSQVCWL